MDLEKYIRENFPQVQMSWRGLLDVVEKMRMDQGFPSWPEDTKNEIVQKLEHIPFHDISRGMEAYSIIEKDVEDLEWQYRLSTTTKKLH
jgi:hypothetical protein